MVGLLLALLLAPGLAGANPPFECAPGCTDRGNCVPDTGECICPYGYTGKACEVDALSACRLEPNSPTALCGWHGAKSCECYRQCEKYHCREGVCETEMAPADRGCFMRDVPPEQQTSKTPEEGEAGVKYFKGWKEGAAPVDASNTSAVVEAMRFGGMDTLPLSKCEESCHNRGYCRRSGDHPEQNGFCHCLRGFKGPTCQEEDPLCELNCNGHGKCIDMYCHCEKGYFSLGCSRSRSVPATSRPNPVSFKIYMYELNTQIAHHLLDVLGSGRYEIGTALYGAYLPFLEQFLTSPVRTDDPSEASLFFIPALTYPYSKMARDGNEHLTLVVNHVRRNYPYWNRTGGRDHFIFQPQDRACHLQEPASDAMKLIHFGYYHPDPKASIFDTVREQSIGVGYSCYHPQRDVVAVPQDTRHKEWAARSNAQTVDEIIKGKKRLFFFAGGGVEYFDAGGVQFSGYSRQTLHNLTLLWKDPDIEWHNTNKDGGYEDYEAGFRESRFCFAPYGWGWGIRLPQAVVCNCIPVIVQERVFQAYEDILPYETFSVRLTNADLPRMREILRGITEQQYRGMMEQLVRYRDAFHWYPESGGRAFDYTIASLRRRHMNQKALYY